MENSYKIAVLMTCHNRKEKTLACLKSLFESTKSGDNRFDVYLVDDGSTDGTGTAVLERHPEVTVINGNGDLFWNRGMNIAWQTAAQVCPYDFFLWLNDDVILYNESIHILLKDFQRSGRDETIVVGACQSVTGKVTYSGYRSLTKKALLKPSGELQLCDYFNGNVVLIPSKVFSRVGFLDPIFHHGQGDFDYGLRAKKLGINSFVSSQFIGVCERNTDLPRWCNPELSLSTRWKSFKSPLGGRPKSTLIFQKKYIGLVPAVFHYFTIHLRLLFPKIWIKE